MMMTQMPSNLTRPHRGVMILVFGILSLVLCAIFGVVAWVMANADLREMDAGRMDPEGRTLTLIGKILGIVSIALWAVGLVIWVLIVFVVGAAAVAGAAGANP